MTRIKFESLKEYHALNSYIEEHYVEGADNYLMIDEVQLCENFEVTINSILSDAKFDIYLTGSNAFLLSSDLATLFTGRHIEIHVFPFSFREYLDYYNNWNDLQAMFDEYIKLGGLAGSYSYSAEKDRYRYIRDVYQTILIRDLAGKYKLSNSTVMKKVSSYLMDSVGNISSIRNISDVLAKDGETTTHLTVGNYVEYLCNAFVFYKANRYDVRGKTYLQTLDKYYLADTGLRFAVLGKRNMDWGRMIENIVYVELLRRGYEVYVGKLYQKEIDFVAMKGNEKIYIQVSDKISEEATFNREIEPLLQIRDAYPKVLLARTGYEQYDYEGIKIIDVPRWLIGNEV